MVLQAFLEDINDESIHAILDNYLFDPLGMTRANSRIDKSVAYLGAAAWQHGAGGAAADWVAHAPILASNIYSSSEDYAKAMIVAMNEGVSAEHETLIPLSHAQALLERQDYGGGLRSLYGFGVQLENDATESADQDFFHGGSFTNRARTFMRGNPTRDEGIVVLLNSGSNNAAVLINEIRRAYIAAVGWPTNVTCN